jgi:hypothetical protein
MGLVTVIHTFGADIKWHPHLHLLVTEAGLSLDGERWVRPYNLGWLMSHAGLKKMWKYHVVRAFRDAHKNGELRFRTGAGFLKLYPRFSSFLGKLRQFIWYAHISGLFATRWRRDYLAQARRALSPEQVPATSNSADPENPADPADPANSANSANSADSADSANSADSADSANPGAPDSLGTWRERRQGETGVDPLRCSHRGQSMHLKEVAFGPHNRIEQLFRSAGHPLKPFSPALAMGP